MSRFRRVTAGAVLAALGMLALASNPSAQAPEQFSGIVANTSARGGLNPFRIQISRYSTDEERQRFLGILANDGWQALEQEFLKNEVGRFLPSGQMGISIAYARSIPHETGRIIRIATARPIAMFEAMRGTRSRDYAFGLIELRLDEEGHGSGMIYAAARLRFNSNGDLEIESYGNPPFSITTVDVQK